MPTHFKAIFLYAKKNNKLGKQSVASQIIDKGLQTCRKINTKDYT